MKNWTFENGQKLDKKLAYYLRDFCQSTTSSETGPQKKKPD